MRRFFERTLSLESRIFDSILAGNASHGLAQDSLDVQKMAQLERHDELLNALDKWIQSPDPRLYSQLRELAAHTRELYQFPASLLVYRGFDLHSPYQNTMGLSQRGLMGNIVKKGLLNDSVHQWSDHRPISFTTDEKIAQAFGTIVVRTEVNPNSPGTLVVTPELAALVCKRRNIDSQTQKEVILLPPVECKFAIHSKRAE